jgi:dTDP-L-rhamnose 4-epimerase
MKENILITGGAGFIGSNLALKLLGKGYNVTILDNLSQQIHGNEPEKTSLLYNSIKNRVIFIKGDVKNKHDWKKSLKGQDIVIHLAAETGTGQSMYEIEKYINTNIRGTSILLDILTSQKHSIKKVIVASSRAIYGEGKYKCNKHGYVYPNERKEEYLLKGDFNCKCPICNNNVDLEPTDEGSKIHPISIYGISKQSQEQMIMLTGKALNIPCVALRYQNVYGPGQSLGNPYTGILSIFSTQIKNGHNINIFEDGKESRDFVYIDDVVNATIKSIENDNANYQVFNIGFGKSIDVLSIANILKNEYKSDIDIKISGNYRIGDIRHNYADLGKIREKLEYEPEYDIDKGIRKFVEWVNDHEICEDNFLKSINELKKYGIYK